MTLSFEALLVLGVIGFYLYDSTMMLYSNELVFTAAGGKWRFASAESHWQMLGKNLYLPNPLTPGRALFRVCWFISGSKTLQEDDNILASFVDALTPIRRMTYGLFALLFIGLPVVIFGLGTGLSLLIIVISAYLLIAVMLIQVLRQRLILCLSKKAVAKLASDSLACAPFALNLLRKITLQRSLTGDPVMFAQKNFDAATLTALIHILNRHIDSEIIHQDEASSRHHLLIDYRKKITSMMP